MHVLKAHVENGRIVVDEPTSLPDGMEVYLVASDQAGDVVLLGNDGLDEEGREELLNVIDESLAEAETGNVEDFSRLIAELAYRRESRNLGQGASAGRT